MDVYALKLIYMLRAQYHDKEWVANLLANTFEQNKSVNYIIKQDSRKPERIKRLMKYAFDLCFLYGDIFLTEDKKGCALILMPDLKKTTLKNIFRDLTLSFAVLGIKNARKAMRRETRVKMIHPSGLLYYLWFIGVEISEHGRGIGTQLLQEVIKSGEEKKRKVCLETSTLKNLPWYQKNGFHLYKEMDFGYTLYCLESDKCTYV